jgi:hypothetical protein
MLYPVTEHVGSVETLVREYTALYDKSSDRITLPPRRVSWLRKVMNERRIDRFLRSFFERLREISNETSPDVIRKEEVRQEMISMLLTFERKRLLWDNPYIGFFLDKGYIDNTDHFIRDAKAYDEKLDPMDLFQAIRNVWIMNSLQLLFGVGVAHSKSIFSYSMLYPYTDNFLDDKDVPRKVKKEFNDRFAAVIAGESVTSFNEAEEKIYNLIHKIEEEYPRNHYGQIYESLQLIHDAQVASLLQHGREAMGEEEVLDLSFYKGGTSVLADGYLVKPDLSGKERSFAFGYGTFLQLIDDLQDMTEDRENGSQTLYSCGDPSDCLDDRVAKILSYTRDVLDREMLATEDEGKLKDIIYDNSILMVVQCVAANRNRFSKPFYRAVSRYSKVRLSFYEKLNETVRKAMEEEELVRLMETLK